MHPEDFKRRHILRVISSCMILEQLESCRGWISYLVKREILREDASKIILYNAIEMREEELVCQPPRRNGTLPYVKKRSERITRDEEAKRHIKLVKNVISE